MAGSQQSPPLSVEDAKARLRLAAARAEPTEMVGSAIRSSPWAGVGAFLLAGLVIGATPALRASVGRLVATGMKSLRAG